MNDELVDISQKQGSLEAQTKNQASEITSLLDKYNSIVSFLS